MRVKEEKVVHGKIESFAELKSVLKKASTRFQWGGAQESRAGEKSIEPINSARGSEGFVLDFSALKLLELEKRNIERTRNSRLISKLLPPLDKKIEEERRRLESIRYAISQRKLEEERERAEEERKRHEEYLKCAAEEKSRMDLLEAAKFKEALGLLGAGIVSKCPKCDWGQNVTECNTCGGSGLSAHKELMTKAMATVCDNRSPNCPRCAGTGTFTCDVRVFDFPVCRGCNGKGWVSTPCSNCERGLVVRDGESFSTSLYDHFKRAIQSRS